MRKRKGEREGERKVYKHLRLAFFFNHSFILNEHVPESLLR